MAIALKLLVAFVALEHVYFLVLEMFLWQKPLGLKTFHQTPAQAEATAKLAANQGLYNGFLAAGLLWSLVTSGSEAFAFTWFFLGCVVVAGIFGAITVGRRILFILSGPRGAHTRVGRARSRLTRFSALRLDPRGVKFPSPWHSPPERPSKVALAPSSR